MKQELIHTAIDNLHRHTSIKAAWKNLNRNTTDSEFLLEFGKQTISFPTEVKREVQKHHLPHILKQAAEKQPFLLLAGQILPAVKQTLREKGIAYLEANGNLFIQHQNIYIWIEVHKPLKLAPERGNRAFTKTGLKVVFLFLQDETWLNKPYRQIAELTGTGVGNITNIMNGLKEDGFLLPAGKNEHKLHQKKELLNKWTTAYETRLKPDLKIGTFRFLTEAEYGKWQNLPLKPGKTWWGGEPAGALYTNYLRPAEFTLYTTENRNELIRDYRLVPDTNGRITVYEKFWHVGDTNQNAVPPLLAYADLLNMNDSRCMETAQKLYEQYLQDQF